MAENPARSPHEIGATGRADARVATRVDGPGDKRVGVLDPPVPFGRYYLLERLDLEGRTEVYRARAGGSDSKLVAVKRILSTAAASRMAMEQFAGEVEAAANLTHPTIARILDRGWVEDAYYVALEHVFGRDLRSVVKVLRERRERMPRSVATYLVMKVCEGLAYAHVHRDATGRSPGLVHRNVSPQSILLAFDGDIKLINFGIARTMGRRGTTVSGIVKGTYGYMSPEQVRGLPIDPRSDIFSCGIVLYELLTGEHPFVGRDEFDMLEKVRTVEFVPPRVHAADLPDELERIVCKALARHADERYQRAVDLQDDLQTYLFTAGGLQARQELMSWLAGLFSDGLAEDENKLARYRSLALPGREPPGSVTEPMEVVEPNPAGPDTVDGLSPVSVTDESDPALFSKRRWDQADTRLYESNRPPVELVAQTARRTLVDMVSSQRDTDLAVRLPRPPSVPPLGPPPGPPPVLPRSLPPNWDAVDSLSTAERTPPERMPPERAPVLVPAQLAPTREYGAAMAEAAMAIAAEREAARVPEPARAVTPPPAPKYEPPRSSARRILYIAGGAIGALLLVLGGALTSRYLLDTPAPVTVPGATIATGPAAIVPAAGLPAPEAAGSAPGAEATGAAPGAEAAGASALPAEVLAASGFDLFVEPADAAVKLDGKLLDMAAPMRIRHLAPGTYELLISAPSGFFSKTERVTVTAGQAPVVRIQLDPIEVRGRFTSEPPGATVSLVGADGETTTPLGTTPVEHVLDPRVRYQAVFEKPGFETVRVDVVPGRGPELPVHARLAAAAVARADSSPDRTRATAQAKESGREPRSRQSGRRGEPRERQKEQGASAPAEPAAGKTGVLMLGSKPPCHIFIDGQDTSKTTPQRSITLPAGRHTIKLVNRDHGIEETFAVTIAPGETTRVIKDMTDRIQ